MIRSVLFGALLAASSGTALAQAPGDEPQPLACVPASQARELLFQQKLVAPIRAMRQAAMLAGAESIDIQLCRFQGMLVYDVTLLDRDGRVVHRLMSANTGAPLGGRPKP